MIFSFLKNEKSDLTIFLFGALMKKTKIICTIGPASDTEKTISAMTDAGMDVVRLNFSHGTHEDYAKKNSND